jgi:acyl-coenzyme A synthetase/AMP-(fatty) acid ligase
MMVAATLAVIKAGGVVVATMPLLRAKEIAYPLAKAKIRLALSERRRNSDRSASVNGMATAGSFPKASPPAIRSSSTAPCGSPPTRLSK